MEKNKMREIEIEKVTLNVSGIGDKLEKGARLLHLLTGEKPMKIASIKRIPSWGVRPQLEVGCKVTIRNKGKIKVLLTRVFSGIENEIRLRQIQDNHLSFGLEEYIEIPGMEYQRDIGMMGFEVDVAFSRKGGKRNTLKKIKKGKPSAKQIVSKEEIIKYVKKNFELKIKGEEK